MHASKFYLQDVLVETHNGWTELPMFAEQCRLLQRPLTLVKQFLEEHFMERSYLYKDSLTIRGLHEKVKVEAALQRFCREYVLATCMAIFCTAPATARISILRG